LGISFLAQAAQEKQLSCSVAMQLLQLLSFPLAKKQNDKKEAQADAKHRFPKAINDLAPSADETGGQKNNSRYQ
jgi:hypothetical protein